jgi:hypothetical protein
MLSISLTPASGQLTRCLVDAYYPQLQVFSYGYILECHGPVRKFINVPPNPSRAFNVLNAFFLYFLRVYILPYRSKSITRWLGLNTYSLSLIVSHLRFTVSRNPIRPQSLRRLPTLFPLLVPVTALREPTYAYSKTLDDVLISS